MWCDLPVHESLALRRALGGGESTRKWPMAWALLAQVKNAFCLLWVNSAQTSVSTAQVVVV